MKSDLTILAVDDEPFIIESIEDYFEGEYVIEGFSDPRKALEVCQVRHFDVLLADYRMPHLSGFELLLEAKKRKAYSCGIMLTAYADKDLLVQIINQNLIQFILEKPLDMNILSTTFQEAEVYIRDLRALHLGGGYTRPIIGLDGDLSKVYQVLKKAASTQENILITGETGTGKEVLARKIHQESKRSKGPFVKINCAAIPDHLLESELFGYARGAFTGAIATKIGKIETADRGTLFLDEISELKPEIQSKLLSVLQDRKVERVGSNIPIPVDFRLISATNRNLEGLVQNGMFRDDLYYRLNTIPLHLPPLRERRADILRICETFLREFGLEFDRPGLRLSREGETLILGYPWPGNIRELENVLKRAIVLLPPGKRVLDRDAFSFLANYMTAPLKALENPNGFIDTGIVISQLTDLVEHRLLSFPDIEERVIAELFRRYQGNIPAIVRATSISRDRLYRRKHRMLPPGTI